MTTSHSADITYGELIVQAFERFAPNEAFVLGDQRLTYTQAADLLSRIQQVLAQHGISRGSAVAALSPNTPEVWLVQAAAYLLGASYTGLHPLGSVDDHLFICADAGATVVIVHPAFAETAEEIAERTASDVTLLTLGPTGAGADLMQLIDDVSTRPLKPGPADLEDTAWLQYTGGTTGKPKGVMLPHRAMVQEVESFALCWGLPEQPRYLAAAPITHAAVLGVMPTLWRGGCVVLQQSFDPGSWARAVEDERINFSFLVPTMLYALLDSGEAPKHDMSSLETLAYAAATIAPSRLTEALEVFGKKLVQGYGQSECIGMATSLLKSEHDPDNRPELLTSCGKAVAGARVDVLDEDGRPVPTGEVGELCVRSRAVMTGYLNQPELTAEVLRNGWLRTSDMARRDEAGFLHIVDRKKDMVITGGFNVYPREVEDVIAEQPGVAAVAVVGLPHEKWGEAVTAYVVPRAGVSVDPDLVVSAVRDRKGSHQAPKAVHIVDKLPQTPAGKIDKKFLRAQAER